MTLGKLFETSKWFKIMTLLSICFIIHYFIQPLLIDGQKTLTELILIQANDNSSTNPENHLINLMNIDDDTSLISNSIDCMVTTLYNPYKSKEFKRFIDSVIRTGCQLRIFNQDTPEVQYVSDKIKLPMIVGDLFSLKTLLTGTHNQINIFSTSDIQINKLPLSPQMNNSILVSYKASYHCDKRSICTFYLCTDKHSITMIRESGEIPESIRNICADDLIKQKLIGIDLIIFKNINLQNSDLKLPFRGREIDWYILGQLLKSGNIVLDSTHCGHIIHKEHPSKHDNYFIKSNYNWVQGSLKRAECEEVFIKSSVNEDELFKIDILS